MIKGGANSSAGPIILIINPLSLALLTNEGAGESSAENIARVSLSSTRSSAHQSPVPRASPTSGCFSSSLSPDKKYSPSSRDRSTKFICSQISIFLSATAHPTGWLYQVYGCKNVGMLSSTLVVQVIALKGKYPEVIPFGMTMM